MARQRQRQRQRAKPYAFRWQSGRRGKLAYRRRYCLACCDQISEQTIIDVEVPFVLAPVPDLMADRGFPVRIAIDYSFSTADEELGFVIRDFRTR